MPTISVLYPRSDGASFDFDHYRTVHLPLIEKRWGGAGLVSVKALRGLGSPGGGEAPFVALALISFGTADQFQAALGSEQMSEIMADIANFTNVKPIIQVNEAIGA